MIKAFKEALENGQIQPVVWPDGKPFVIDGVTYYQANNSGIDMAMGRFHSLGDLLRKHDSLKLSDEMLTTAIVAMKDQIRTAMARLSEEPEEAEDTIRFALTTIERMQQRREFGMDIAQVYELAAIWFFSEQEDPAVVDSELNRQKIAAWMQHPMLYAFFLSRPLSHFVPSQRLASEDTLSFINKLNLQELLDWKITLLKSPQFGLTPATIRIIELRVETLLAWTGLIDVLLRSTTATSPDGSEMSAEKPPK
ncbi:hypothetical protein [Larkinella rosea]|uniref:Uncharacterized protein n=1 Tax=Larkinella rosea TaxID=2025312 RepID=A0A3P1BZJ8_9BACT|nr:hypothetical protein [Larkinella rosea]RRB06286.1 hypothetical protein EHT25_00325 [Larkinella rosea]